jgi:diphthamide biosynthesis methyltransferase
VLLEIDVENQRHVTIPQALEQLISGAELRPNNVVKPETLVVGIARLEAPDMIVLAGTVSDLKRTEFGEPPYCLIFPAALHFVEAEALQVLCGAAENLVAREA